MSRRVAVVIVVLLVLTAGGLILTYIQKARLVAHLTTSQNNLRQLAQFAAHHANPDPKRDATKLPRDIPAATVLLPDVSPENRLSWFVYVMPGLNQRQQDIVALFTQIDQMQPWTAERNQAAARTRLVVALCPLNTPEVPPDQPGVTCYVAISGLGPDAATLALPPAAGRAPPRAGAWRYDAATPFQRIDDGLSQTLLMGETADNPGPWLRGGPSTTRGLNDAPEAKPLLGTGGQFGGYFPNGANFALCDGSVRLFTPKTTPGVLRAMATIAGSEKELIVGE
jgi:prepilin-type processing-associated H-X9-DG protein